MRRCPHCDSHNESRATFCSQCGARLALLPSARTRLSTPRRRYRALALGAILLGLLGAVLALVYWAPEEPGWEAPSSSVPAPEAGELVAREAADRRDLRDDVRKEAARADLFLAREEGREPRMLDAAQATSSVSPALVVLDLRDAGERPWRQIRGVLVDSSGVVLCRFRPLLGAVSGVCRVAVGAEARVDIIGLSYRVEDLDLALLRIRSSPTGYPSVSLLSERPADVLADGDPLHVFSDYKAIPTTVSDTFYPLDGAARIRLAAEPPLPPESFLAVDAYALVLGLCRIEQQGEPSLAPGARPAGRWVVDPVSPDLADALDYPAAMSLEDLTRTSYTGTFSDLIHRGGVAFLERRWGEAIELFEQALERAAPDGAAEDDIRQALAKLEKSYLTEIQRLLDEDNRPEEAGALAEAALARFGENVELWVLLGRSRLALKAFDGAVAALVEAQELRRGEAVDGLLERAYLELAAEWSESGGYRQRELTLLAGIERLPSSARLLLELAKIYFEIEAFDDSARLLDEVRRLDAGLRPAAETILARIDDALKRRDAVIIPIAPEGRSYRTQAVVDGRGSYTFIIDTGATYTTLPSQVAAELGYDTSRAQQIQLSTAGGVISAPLLQIHSLDVGGYSVRNLQVVVLPPGVGPAEGLLGLNFLKHFKYTVDASRSEFRLERS
jgi:clan AA aspartic protease (TIGR02281 family)